MPDNARYVQFGVASHNLFDLCYAMLLREREGVRDQVEFEMLEGMANHQVRVIRQAADGLLLYAPVVLKEDFHSAIAYLVRRLDENTSEENFLHDLFGMTPGSRSWEVQKKRFLKACQEKDEVKYGPNRTQNRAADPIQPLALPGRLCQRAGYGLVPAAECGMDQRADCRGEGKIRRGNPSGYRW